MSSLRRVMLLGVSLLMVLAQTTQAAPFLPKQQVASLKPSTSRIGRANAGAAVASSPLYVPRLAQGSRLPASAPRGGASSCSDSDFSLFVKVGIGAVVEAALMLGVIVGTKALAEKHLQVLPNVVGLSVLRWLGLVVVIFASSFLGSIVDGSLSAASRQVLAPNELPGDPGWYDSLVKPAWNPPGWVFPIMWLVVSKPTQLVAVSRILKKAGDGPLNIPVLSAYCAHLALGDVWNKVFFGLQCPGRGAAVISVFFALLLNSAYLFGTIDPTAGKFMLPTCGWVFVAACLNWNIYLNNK